MRIRVVKFDGENTDHQVAAVLLFRAWKFRDPNGHALIQTHTTPERTENFIEVKKMFEGVIIESQLGNNKVQWSLAREGYETKLRQSTVDLLAESWNAWKPICDPDLGEQVQTTDAFLKELPLAPDIGDAVPLAPKQRRAGVKS